MRHHRLLLLVLLSVLCPATVGWAQDDPPAEPPDPGTSPDALADEADLAFTELREDFSLLYRSLQASGGVLDEDRQAIQTFLGRVEAFGGQWPEHAGAVAMRIQLLTWLGEEETVDELYLRLMELMPDSAEIALLWLRRLEQSAADDPQRVLAARQELLERFPDNAELRLEWARYLKGEARYEEAIDALEAGAFDPAEEPDAVQTLADCLFAVHRFDEALTTLDSIPAAALERNFRVKREVERLRPSFEEYGELWAREQEIRQAEAAADDLPRVEIHTSKGLIVVELFENEAPNTVANFIKLAEEDFWVQTKFHRREPDFMIQGGDPNTKPDGTGQPGLGNPGYYIPDEHNADNHRNHFSDSLAMAKRPDPNSAGCQFYFNFRPTPWLNGIHTVFGRVVEGQDIVRLLRVDDEIALMVVRRKRDHEYEPATLPLNRMDSIGAAPGGG